MANVRRSHAVIAALVMALLWAGCAVAEVTVELKNGKRLVVPIDPADIAGITFGKADRPDGRPTFTNFPDFVASVPPGGFRGIGNSVMQAAKDVGLGHEGIEGPGAKINAWGSAAWVDDRCAYFTGGGHGAYPRNQFFVWCVDTMRFGLSHHPAPVTRRIDSGQGFDCPVPDDGTPPNAHVASNLAWAPNIRRIIWIPSVNYCDNFNIWDGVSGFFLTFDPETRTFEKHVPDTGGIHPDCVGDWFSCGNYMGGFKYDPVTGHLFGHGRRYAYEFDPVAMRYVRTTWPDGSVEEGPTLIDLKRRRLVLIPWREDLVIATVGLQNLRITVAKRHGIPGFWAWGLVHDTKRDVYVAWNGSRSFKFIDPETWKMTDYEVASGPAPKSTSSGIYDKFHYLPEWDVFAAYSNPNEPMWFFRMPEVKGD
ncbi:MAG: hypothetical protein ACE5GT_13425 [Rhodospirillales bacterium]